jgi:Transposase DDE domain
MPNLATILKQQFLQSICLPWHHILPESRLEEILKEEGITYRNCIYTPVVTLCLMISQVLSPDKSLSNAITGITTWLAAAGVNLPSGDTGAYCKARQRLPESLFTKLVTETADQLEQRVLPEHQWCDLRVRVCDGTTILMSGSNDNQAAYPQHGNQSAGCGFPLLKLVVIFSLVTGAVAAVCIAPWCTSEIVMSRMLYEFLSTGDVLLADRAYGNYVDLAMVQQQGAHGVFRKHQARYTDFRRGKRLGAGDHLVTWFKPKKCPKHMTPEQFEALPENLLVREVILHLERRGYRTERIIVVTTLLDEKLYSAKQLTILYGWRWSAAEINLRHLKTTLGMEMLTSKSPSMVRKELLTHILAYNLLRTVMEQAGHLASYCRARLSLQGTRQLFNHMLSLLALLEKAAQKRLYAVLLREIAEDLLPVRPNRHEPRVIKRRPKSFPRMRQSRDLLKAKLVF